MMKNNNIYLKLRTSLTNLQSDFKQVAISPVKRRILKDRFMDILANILKYVLLYGLCFIILYPLLLQIAVALRLPEDVNNPTVMWIPETFSLQNYDIAATAMEYWKALWNTFWLSFWCTLLQVTITSIVGYALARIRFFGRNVIFALVLLTIIVPPMTISLPSLITFSKLKLVGKPVTLFLMTGFGMGIKSGIFIYLFRQFFKGIPYELEEAAQIDGANAFQVFWRVMLPNAMGAIITVSLLAFVWQWNDNYWAGMFLSETKYPTLSSKLASLIWGISNVLMQKGIWALLGQDITKNPFFSSMILNAGGLLAMLPLLIMYFFVQRLFVEGVERTGIVG